MLLSSRRAGTPRCGALVVPLLCCDGRDTIQGRRAGSVKDLRPRFTHTDIHAGQGHLSVPLTSLRCRRWQRSQASGPHLRVAPTGSGPTAWWSLVIDSAHQVCATRPHPILPTAPARHRHGRGHSARPGARPSGRGHSTPSGTANPSPHARDVPGRKKVSPHAQDVPGREGMSPHAQDVPGRKRVSPHA